MWDQPRLQHLLGRLVEHYLKKKVGRWKRAVSVLARANSNKANGDELNVTYIKLIITKCS